MTGKVVKWKIASELSSIEPHRDYTNSIIAGMWDLFNSIAFEKCLFVPRGHFFYLIPESQWMVVSVYALAFTLTGPLLEQKGRILDAAAERIAYSPGST